MLKFNCLYMSTIFSTGVYLNTSYVKVQYREKGGTKQ